jgi:hypothetical protein
MNTCSGFAISFRELFKATTLLSGVTLAGCSDAQSLEPQGESESAVSSSAANRCLPTPGDIPPALAAPSDECLSVSARGVGVQIYTCTAGAWVFTAPEANLLNRSDTFVGNHYFGPTWQWRDGSKVHASVSQRVAAPDAVQDIPWLLLSVVPSPSEGPGRLAGIQHIQRVHTSGGVAPDGTCNNGDQVRIPYTADYLFYGPASAPPTTPIEDGLQP